MKNDIHVWHTTDGSTSPLPLILKGMSAEDYAAKNSNWVCVEIDYDRYVNLIVEFLGDAYDYDHTHTFFTPIAACLMPKTTRSDIQILLVEKGLVEHLELFILLSCLCQYADGVYDGIMNDEHPIDPEWDKPEKRYDSAEEYAADAKTLIAVIGLYTKNMNEFKAKKHGFYSLMPTITFRFPNKKSMVIRTSGMTGEILHAINNYYGSGGNNCVDAINKRYAVWDFKKVTELFFKRFTRGLNTMLDVLTREQEVALIGKDAFIAKFYRLTGIAFNDMSNIERQQITNWIKRPLND